MVRRDRLSARLGNVTVMPDQSRAADEHAILQEITAPLASLPDDSLPSPEETDFPRVRRGYDPLAVDAYVRKTRQLIADLQARRSPDAAVRRALERVGEQISGILQRAHDTAEQITTQSRREAEDRLEQARQEALDIAAAGVQRVKDLDADADRIWAERLRIVEDARELAAQLTALADAAAERFPPAEDATGGTPGVEPAGIEPASDEAASDETALDETALDETALDETALDARSEAEAAELFDAEADEEEIDPEATAVLPVVEQEPPSPPDQPPPLDQPPPDQPQPWITAAGSAAAGSAAAAAVAGIRPAAAEAMTPRLIELHHLGRERVIGCWQVGDILIDPGPSSCLPSLLEALGDERPRALLLTHIHLDHAGASGSLVRRWPDLEVYVHERGAPHMVDPARLLESARRLYGDDMDRLWGEFIAVPEGQIRILTGGESLIDGAFEVAYTPGHASHHVSYLHDGTAFVGDVGGVRITTDTITIPPTPPPDIDVEAWLASIELIRRWAPERLAMTHFGASEDVTAPA